MLADLMMKIMSRPIFEGLRDRIIGDVMEYIGKDLIVSASYCRAVFNSLVE